MNILERHRAEIVDLCDKHHVMTLHAFGSVLDNAFSEHSDIDLLVQFGHVELPDYFDNYMSFMEQLEKLLKRHIDLVENQAIRNPIFRAVVDRKKKIVYERKSAQMVV